MVTNILPSMLTTAQRLSDVWNSEEGSPQKSYVTRTRQGKIAESRIRAITFLHVTLLGTSTTMGLKAGSDSTISKKKVNGIGLMEVE